MVLFIFREHFFLGWEIPVTAIQKGSTGVGRR